MRLGSVLSEALRNIGSGVSRAFAMFLAVLLSGTLLGGYEAMTVIDLESQAVQRINAYADVNAIVGGTVDGTACDRLSDAGDGMTGTLAGAMRAGKQVVPLATPGKDISSYDVTPGMIRLIAGNAKADVSGVWVPRDVAKDFGLAVGSALQTREGTTRVAGVFDWPNDGRDTRFAYAFIVPVSASASTENLLYATLVAGSGSSNAGVTQVNKGFDAHYDARASYVNRSTRWMPWVGLAIGVLVGVFGVRRRRLEYAGALHSGQSKGAQLLGIGVETGVWAGLATFASCALLLAYAVRMSRSDWAAVLAAAVRTPLAVFAGVMVASLFAGLLIRESQLFRFFKKR